MKACLKAVVLEDDGMFAMTNERECQRGVFQTEAAATTAGGKDCADPGNRQQVGVGEA